MAAGKLENETTRQTGDRYLIPAPGGGLAAVTVLIGAKLVAMTTTSFFLFNVILVTGWLGFTLLLIQ